MQIGNWKPNWTQIETQPVVVLAYSLAFVLKHPTPYPQFLIDCFTTIALFPGFCHSQYWHTLGVAMVGNEAIVHMSFRKMYNYETIIWFTASGGRVRCSNKAVRVRMFTNILLTELWLGYCCCYSSGSFHVKSTQKNPYPHEFERNLVCTQCLLRY